MNRTRPLARGGFSIIEAAVATAILGVGILALVSAVAASSTANVKASELTSAVFLAQEIREWTARLPFTDPDESTNVPVGPDGQSPQVFVDDLDDLMDVTFSPPRDGTGQQMMDMTGWSQTIRMTWRKGDNLEEVVQPGQSDIIFVHVTISKNGRVVHKTGWFAVRRPEQ